MESQKMFFLIADISGYTAFMIKNQMDYAHGTLIVTELMKALVKEVDFPFQISKLEGDAVFFFIDGKEIIDYRKLGDKALQLFTSFFDRLGRLQSETTCDCGACSHIKELNLKMVVHYGEATIDQIGGFKELSGVDVILAHRLLKNQVQEKCYLLLTLPAFELIQLPGKEKAVRREEKDKDLGSIPIYVYYPPFAPQVEEAGSLVKMGRHIKLALYDQGLKWGLIKERTFNNVPKIEK